MEMSEGLLAGYITLAIGLMKVLDTVITAAVKKYSRNKNGDKVYVVQLDPEASRMIRETNENARDVVNILSVRDPDGTPLVYSSRRNDDTLAKMSESMTEVTHIQERITDNLERIEDKIENNTRLLIASSQKN